MEFVSWDSSSQYQEKKTMFQTTNQIMTLILTNKFNQRVASHLRHFAAHLR